MAASISPSVQFAHRQLYAAAELLLLPPPQPATASATTGMAAAPAIDLMDLLRIMLLLR